jgi:Uma2 family endonuclease
MASVAAIADAAEQAKTAEAAVPVEGIDRRVVLHHISWRTYESLLADHQDRSVPRFTYDRGVLEIVCPSAEHEEASDTLKLVVEIVAASLSVPVKRVGSMTYRREDLRRGFEPDGSFYIQNAPRVRGRRQIDPDHDPPPDLVIEMEFSRLSLDKLPIFAQLGVPEVWRCDRQRVNILVLTHDAYQESLVSLALPPVTSEILTRFLADRRTILSPDWFQAVSEWALAQLPAGGVDG